MLAHIKTMLQLPSTTPNELSTLLHELQSIVLGFGAAHETVGESLLDRDGELRRESGVSGSRILQRLEHPVALLRRNVGRGWDGVDGGIDKEDGDDFPVPWFGRVEQAKWRNAVLVDVGPRESTPGRRNLKRIQFTT